MASNSFQDEHGKDADFSMAVECIDDPNETSDCNESINQMLIAYRECMNTSDVSSDHSEDELEIDDSDFDDCFGGSMRKASRLDLLKQKYNEVKVGNFEFVNNFEKSFVDLPIKHEVDVDFKSMTNEQFSEYVWQLDAAVKKKKEETPSLIAQNMKIQLDKVKESVEQIMNKALNLEPKENISDNTRLMNILNLSKSVIDGMKSIDVKVQKANELINTLKLYSKLKEDKK